MSPQVALSKEQEKVPQTETEGGMNSGVVSNQYLPAVFEALLFAMPIYGGGTSLRKVKSCSQLGRGKG